MKRGLLVGGAAILVLGLWRLPRPGTEPAAPTLEVRAPGIEHAVVPPRRGSSRGPASPEEPSRAAQAYDTVVRACGFEMEERCVASGCGAVVAMPDLDRFDGWVELAMTQPGVVLGTAARDVGLPVGWSACGEALLGSPEVMAAKVGFREELWCVGDRGACDEAASERFGWRGFSGQARLTRRVFRLDGGQSTP